MDIPLIEQVKIQAQILVPLVKSLQAELGEERANAIVRKALGDLYRKYGEKWWRAQGARDLGERMASAFDWFAAGDALRYEVVKQAPDAFDVNVTGCRYAQFYKEIGAPELGSLLTCSGDLSMADGFGADVQLTRTQTIMQGAGYCDFRYVRRHAARSEKETH
jgi:L-2-amino-thiazoline-4-carboxylic acid hydrolase-like protein